MIIKEYLHAFGNGNLEWEDLITTVEEKAGTSLDSAQTVLLELDEAYEEDILNIQTLNILKKSVISSVNTRISKKPGLDLDVSQPDESSIPTVAITSIPVTSTSVPQIKITKGSILRDRFVIDEMLGEGGMGTVYKGRDLLKEEARDRNPFVAIKVLNEDIKQRSDSFIALQREASRQQRLAHPNIATVYDFDRVDNLIFITMELLVGKPLNKFLKKIYKEQGRIEKQEAFRIIVGLSNALKYAHDHQIIHSDFKPANCFFRDDGVIKVLDFGIARAIRKSEDEETTEFDGRDMGAMTMTYASLEMIEKSADPHPSDDVYALACVSYEVLTGEHPFNRLPANAAYDNKLNVLPIANLTRKENKAIAHALAFRREDRTPSVDIFLEELIGEQKSPSILGRYAAIGGGVVAAGVAISVTMNLYQENRVENIINNVSSGDPVLIQQAMVSIEGVDPSQRIQILTTANDNLTRFFSDQISIEIGKLDFLAAEDLIAQARSYYPDSARIESTAENLIEEKGRVLASLGEQYDRFLLDRRLVSSDDSQDLPTVIQQLKKIDPQNNLLTDVRLATVYSDQARRLITTNRLDEAQDLLDIGMQLSPESVALVNAQDLLNSEIQNRDLQNSITDLEVIINESISVTANLASAKTVEDQILRLSTLDEENTTLKNLAEKLSPEVRQQVAAFENNSNLNALADMRNNYSALLFALNFYEERTSLDNLYESTSGQLEKLVNDIADDIALDNLNTPANANAISKLDELEAIVPDDSRIEQFRSQIVNAYINKARDQRLAGRWEPARNQLALASSITLTANLQQQLEQELQSINSSETAAKDQLQAEARDRAEQERLAAISSLENDIRTTTTTASTTSDARNILQQLNRLTNLNPASPLLNSTPTQLQQKLASAALDVGNNSGDWQNALALIEQSGSLFPDSLTLSNAKIQISQEIDKAKTLARQQEVDGLKSSLLSSISQIPPQPDDTWTNATVDMIKQLAALLPAGDPWLISTRGRIIKHYLDESGKLRSTQRFTLAEQLLNRAEKIAPGLAVITAERNLVSTELRDFQTQQVEQGRLARIDSQKQTFFAHIAAKNNIRAEDTLSLLSAELSDNDPFVRNEAPKVLAGVYYQLAMVAQNNGQFETVIDYANASLIHIPSDNQVLALRADAEIELETLRITEVLETANVLNGTQLSTRVSNVLNNSGNKSDSLLNNWENVLIQRLNNMKDGDTERHNLYLAAAKQILPSSQRIINISPVEIKVEPVIINLSEADILGNWCSQDIDLTLTSNEMTYHLQNGTDISYRVSQYDFTDTNVTVTWSDNQRGDMLTEFSELSDNKNTLIQKRGREVTSSTWNEYNRLFNRCK